MTPDDRAFWHLSPAEQADHWLTLLESPLTDDAHRRDFQAWLDSEPAHRAAWQKANTFWRQLDDFSDDQIAEIERRLPQSAQMPGASAIGKPHIRRRFRATLLPIAASVLLASALSFAYMAGYFADYRTATAQQRLVRLEDGSTVLLNTSSTLSVDYSAHARNVSLTGEGYFNVATDSGRPFSVRTAGGEVRALGTAFDVKQTGDALSVTVYEHAVRVAFKQGQVIERLPEGERIILRDGHLGRAKAVNLHQAQAWQRQQLIFSGQPLAQVVAELNRYRRGAIVILDKHLAEHRVTGVFDTREPEQALTTIETILGLQEWRLTDGLVILRRPG